MESQDTYSRLIELLDQHQARYRLIDHAPEGRTDIVSPLRGNDIKQAAKCIILMVKQGKKTTKYVLGVVSGEARIDMKAVGALMNATYVSFASNNIAEELAGCVSGTVLPLPSIRNWSSLPIPVCSKIRNSFSMLPAWIDPWR